MRKLLNVWHSASPESVILFWGLQAFFVLMYLVVFIDIIYTGGIAFFIMRLHQGVLWEMLKMHLILPTFPTFLFVVLSGLFHYSHNPNELE